MQRRNLIARLAALVGAAAVVPHLDLRPAPEVQHPMRYARVTQIADSDGGYAEHVELSDTPRVKS